MGASAIGCRNENNSVNAVENAIAAIITLPGTVSAWIREQRLIQARRDLADPALRDQPVHVIAARWGFGPASQFNRAFHAAYGYSPSECRPVHRA
jgi:AraC-like DNA-binding protein